jgi:hypothetical protein
VSISDSLDHAVQEQTLNAGQDQIETEKYLRKKLQENLLAAENGAPTPAPEDMMQMYLHMAELSKSKIEAARDDRVASGIMKAHNISPAKYDVDAIAAATGLVKSGAQQMGESSKEAMSYLELESREMLKAKLQANMNAEENGKSTLSPDELLQTYIQMGTLSQSKAATLRNEHLAADTMGRFDLSDTNARQAARATSALMAQLRREAELSGIRDPNSLGMRAATHRHDVDAFIKAPWARGYGDTDPTHLLFAAVLLAMFIGAFRATSSGYEEDWIGMEKRNSSICEPSALEYSLELRAQHEEPNSPREPQYGTDVPSHQLV